MKLYSLNWNAKEGCFIAQIRRPFGPGWLTKRVPKIYPEHQQEQAEAWLIDEVARFRKSGLASGTKEDRPALTIARMVPFWTAQKKASRSTSLGTFHRSLQTIENQILDNPKFSHDSIQDIPIEDLTPPVLLSWIRSLQLGPGSRLLTSVTLSGLLKTYIDRNRLRIANPMADWEIREEQQMLKAASSSKPRPFPKSHIEALFSSRNDGKVQKGKRAQILDEARISYLVTLLHALRFGECCGLVWKDIDFELAILRIERTLESEGGCFPASFAEDLNAETKASELHRLKALPNALLVEPKHGSKRVLPLHPLAAEVLTYWFQEGYRAYCGKDPEPLSPVFPSVNGEFIRPYWRRFRQDIRRSGCSPMVEGKMLSFKSLRSAFSSMLETVGASEGTIGKLLGHSAKTLAARAYIKSEVETYRQYVNRLPLPATFCLNERTFGRKLSLVSGDKKTA